MKIFFLLIIAGLLANNTNGQLSFSSVNCKLTIIKRNNLTELRCTTSAMSAKFKLKHELTAYIENNFVRADDQTIQITPLKFRGYKTDIFKQNLNSQKALLEKYSEYELLHFKEDLNVSIANANNQWVIIKSRGWYIWYFRVEKAPATVAVDKLTQIQLFASTILGDNILTINAPILNDGDFTKAGGIVNEMMETLTTSKK